MNTVVSQGGLDMDVILVDQLVSKNGERAGSGHQTCQEL